MATFNWNSLLNSVFLYDKLNPEKEGGIKDTNIRVQTRVLLKSLKMELLFIGVYLGYIGLLNDWVWLRQSPLFRAVGAVVSLLILMLLCVSGGIFWLFTGDRCICDWVVGLLPFAVQPYRSAFGMIGFFTIVAFSVDGFSIIRAFAMKQIKFLRFIIYSLAALVFFHIAFDLMNRF